MAEARVCPLAEGRRPQSLNNSYVCRSTSTFSSDIAHAVSRDGGEGGNGQSARREKNWIYRGEGSQYRRASGGPPRWQRSRLRSSLRPRVTLVMSRTTCAAGVRALTPSPGGASACACAGSCLGSDFLPRLAGHAIYRLRSYCFPCSPSILSTRPREAPQAIGENHKGTWGAPPAAYSSIQVGRVKPGSLCLYDRRVFLDAFDQWSAFRTTKVSRPGSSAPVR